jgi:putative MATE family efflux protein
MSSALRGTGIVKPTMVVQSLTVLLNVILAPILIGGWVTHHSLGTAGAGLATTLAIAAGVLALWIYFRRLEHYVSLEPKLWTPRWPVIGRILNVGLPGAGDFFLMFVILGVIYFVIRPFGPAAQAGFGIGGRISPALFLPVMALAFSVAPVAGQNFGAGHYGRVRETMRTAAFLSMILMLALTLICQWRPEWFIRLFSTQPDVVAVGADYLRITSWNFIATGLIFTFSGTFQALGNTWPSLASSASRLVTFVLPAIWLSRQPHFSLRQVWYLSVATVALQACTSYVLLRREMARKLGTPKPAAAVAAPAPESSGAG